MGIETMCPKPLYAFISKKREIFPAVQLNKNCRDKMFTLATRFFFTCYRTAGFLISPATNASNERHPPDPLCVNAHIHTPGVEIITRQLAKCEWNLELRVIFLNLLASLASVFVLLSVSLFPR
jgi:hypothetical protein